MAATGENENAERSGTEVAGLAILGIGYLIAGLGLFYGLAIDSMQVFNAALIVIFILLAVSMVIIARNEAIVSQENVVISVCVFVAMALFFGLTTFTTLPYTVLVGILIFVGVLVPMLVLQYGSSIIN